MQLQPLIAHIRTRIQATRKKSRRIEAASLFISPPKQRGLRKIESSQSGSFQNNTNCCISIFRTCALSHYLGGENNIKGSKD